MNIPVPFLLYSGKYVYVDPLSKNLISHLEFDDAYLFKDGYADVTINKKVGCIDINGNVIIPIVFDELHNYCNPRKLFWVKNNLKWGAVNLLGTYIIECNFESYERLPFGWKTTIGNKAGVINDLGKEIVPHIYDYLEAVDDKAIVVGIEGPEESETILGGLKLGLLDVFGNQLTPIIYSYIGDFNNGFAKVGRQYYSNEFFGDFQSWIVEAFGIISLLGKEICNCQFKNVSAFKNGFAILEYFSINFQGPFFEIINEKGQKIGNENYDYIQPYQCGRAIVSMGDIYRDGEDVIAFNGFQGVIDESGKIVVPCNKYAQIYNYEENIAVAIKKNETGNSYGYIDSDGLELTYFEYSSASDFKYGLGKVYKEGKGYGVVNTKGEEVIPCSYQWIEILSQEFLALYAEVNDWYNFQSDPGGKAGLSTIYHEIICPAIYWKIKYFNEKYFLVTNMGDNKVLKDGLIDKKGELVFPCTNELIHGDNEDVYVHNEEIKLYNNQLGFVRTIAFEEYEALIPVDMNFGHQLSEKYYQEVPRKYFPLLDSYTQKRFYVGVGKEGIEYRESVKSKSDLKSN